MGRRRYRDDIEKKEVLITFRLTPSEDDWLHEEMEKGDFISMTKFIKSRLFKSSEIVNPNLDDRRFLDKVNRITESIERIGHSYSDAVSQFIDLCNIKRRDGSPMISFQTVSDELDKLTGLTLDVKAEVTRLIKLVEEIHESR